MGVKIDDFAAQGHMLICRLRGTPSDTTVKRMIFTLISAFLIISQIILTRQ